MSLMYGLGAAAAAAVCGWPAKAAIDRLGRRPAETVDPAGNRPVDTVILVGGGAGDSVGSVRDAYPDAIGPVGGPAHGAASTGAISLFLATLTLGVATRIHPPLVAAAGCWLVVCGVPLAVIDIRVRRLPDALTGVCLAGVAALLTAAAASTGDWHDLARAGTGALAVGLSLALLALVWPGSAGLGDAKFGLSTGALAGWLGWGSLLASVLAANVLAAAVALWLVGTRRATLRGGSVPFGPFLLAGCLVVALLAKG